MSLGNLIFDLRNDQKVLIRKIEKLQRKREKTKNAVIFNQTCLQEDILPKYTKIYILYILYIYSFILYFFCAKHKFCANRPHTAPGGVVCPRHCWRVLWTHAVSGRNVTGRWNLFCIKWQMTNSPRHVSRLRCSKNPPAVPAAHSSARRRVWPECVLLWYE